MDEIVSLIGNVGFPIAVSVYLLVRFEAKLQELTMSMQELAKVIEKLH